jgi:hypothetical protein
MTTLTVELDRVKDLPALEALLNRLGLKYTIKDYKKTGDKVYQTKTPSYKLLSDEDSNEALLTIAEEAFEEGWNTNDKEEDAYWKSFLK